MSYNCAQFRPMPQPPLVQHTAASRDSVSQDDLAVSAPQCRLWVPSSLWARTREQGVRRPSFVIRASCECRSLRLQMAMRFRWLFGKTKLSLLYRVGQPGHRGADFQGRWSGSLGNGGAAL